MLKLINSSNYIKKSELASFSLEDRINGYTIIAEFCKQFVATEGTKLINTYRSKNISLEHSPFVTVMLYNLAGLAYDDTRVNFEEMLVSVNDLEALNLRVPLLATRIESCLGSQFISAVRTSFKSALVDNYKLSTSAVDALLKKFPYLWALPPLSQAWLSVMQ